MNSKSTKKLRFLILGLVSLLVLATTTVAFAWWDRLEQESGEQSLTMGYGVRLVLRDESTRHQGVLVPAGSFYAAVNGYTTEYVFTYELSLEENLDVFDLLIDVSNLTIGGVSYNQAPNVHGPLSIVITSSEGSFESDGYDIDIMGPSTSLRLNEVLQGDGTVTITITFNLLDHVEDAEFSGNLVQAYAALAGQEITFDVAFEIPFTNRILDIPNNNFTPEVPYVIGTDDDGLFLQRHSGIQQLSGTYSGSATSIHIPTLLNGVVIEGIWQNQFRVNYVSDQAKLVAVTFAEDSQITVIGNSAFINNLIEEITLPDHLERIGERAFRSNLLTEIVLPDTVRHIGDQAFQLNPNLHTVVIGADVTIGENAFGPIMDNGFREAYEAGGAGTYHHIDGVWVRQLDRQSLNASLYDAFLSKDSVFNVGSAPFESYNVDSWNGYLEKLFEVGRSEDVTRLSSQSPGYGKNVLGIENSFGEPGNNQLVLNMLNTGVFNYLRRNMPYQEQLPLAILLTNHWQFEYDRDNTFILNNLDVLAGTLVIYKNDQWDNSAVQVYTILENGERSELMDIQDLFDLIP